MRTMGILLLCAFCVWEVSAGGAGSQQAITDARGTIREVNASEGWYGIVPDSDPGTRYAPSNLPEKFRKDGMRVVFSGNVGEVPPDQRMWGTPLELTRIEELKAGD